MLPKKNRLHLRTEFKRLKRDGKLIQGKLFSLILCRSGSIPRFAFIVSKKIAAKAVERNRIRRLLVRAILELLPKIKLDTEAVFLTKRAIIDKNLAEIKKEIEKHLT